MKRSAPSLSLFESRSVSAAARSRAVRAVHAGLVLSALVALLSCKPEGPATCGSGSIESGEVCDGEALAGKACGDFGAAGGTLGCKSDCSGYDTTACDRPASCGNGALDPLEACDGEALNGRTCQREGFGAGTLRCQDNCLGLDTSGCSGTCTPDCSGRVCGPDPICGKACGSCTGAREACDPEGRCALTCDQEPLTTDQTLDLDLGVVTVTGTVTVGGAALPVGPRPTLRFQERSSGTTAVVSFPGSGATTYSVKLWKGTYDVSVRDDSGAGVLGIGQSLGEKLADGVVLSTDTTLNYDLGIVTVSGTVTAGGAALPAGTGRPILQFQNKSTGTVRTVRFASTGSASYSVKLWKGAYDVLVRDDSGVSVLEIGRGLAAKLDVGVMLAADAVKNYDLGVVTVSGTVTVGGAAVPLGSGRPLLLFVNRSTGTSDIAVLSPAATATYSIKLWRGAYDVQVQDTDVFSVVDIGQRLAHQLDAGIVFGADATRNYDLGIVTVSGTVTVNGGAVPVGTRPSLVFQDKSTGSAKVVGFAGSGPATYSTRLWKGTYDVSVRDAAFGSALGIGQSLSARLEAAADLGKSTTRNYDLGVVTVGGTVTANGAELPIGSARPVLLFQNKSTGTTKTVGFAGSGPATYATALWKGAYTVSVKDDTFDGVLGIGGGLAARLDASASYTTDTSRSYDLGIVSLGGTVTVNGAPMPVGSGRPLLLFQNQSSGTTLRIGFAGSGPATYATRLWKGAYDTSARDDTISSVIGIGQGLTKRLVRGCPEAGTGVGACAAWNGTWHLAPQITGIASVDLDLKLSGTDLSGNWHASSGSSGAFTGTRSGDNFVIELNFGGCGWRFEGTVAGCNLRSTLHLTCNSPTTANGSITP